MTVDGFVKYFESSACASDCKTIVVLCLISLPFQTYIRFLLFYNHCDKSELTVFGPFQFYSRVAWCGVPLTNARVRLAVVVIWWMCLFHVSLYGIHELINREVICILVCN